MPGGQGTVRPGAVVDDDWLAELRFKPGCQDAGDGIGAGAGGEGNHDGHRPARPPVLGPGRAGVERRGGEKRGGEQGAARDGHGGISG